METYIFVALIALLVAVYLLLVVFLPEYRAKKQNQQNQRQCYRRKKGGSWIQILDKSDAAAMRGITAPFWIQGEKTDFQGSVLITILEHEDWG